MGRYYSNQFGEEGKFWFAVQPSDDPESVYGGVDVTDVTDIANESEESGYDAGYIDYDIFDGELVKKKLDEQYDILEVPKDKRKFNVPIGERGKYIWEELFDYIFSYEKPDGFDGIPYGDYKDGEHITYYALSKEKELAASRIDLGLFILKTIRRAGVCSMTAEL